MSSLRNAVSRRPHKERSQPHSRQKWGILEKHKDYSLRAADYNLKKKKLGQLSQKAKERNPDEFAFGMMSAGKGTAGKHGKNLEENRLSHDAVRLLKSQDAGYLRVVGGRGRRELARLEEEVRLGEVMREDGDGARGKKIVFGDGDVPIRGKKRKRGTIEAEAEAEVLQEIPTQLPDSNALSEDLDDERAEVQSENRPSSKRQQAKKAEATKSLLRERKRRRRLQELRAAKLEALKKRQREIMAAADVLEAQRARMARSVGGVTKDGIKFKVRERKT